MTSTCPICKRRLSKDIKVRMAHFIKYHPARVEKVLGCILENPFAFGMELAEHVSRNPAIVHRLIRGIQ